MTPSALLFCPPPFCPPSEIVSEIVQLLEARVNQKEEKKYGSPTALVVGFNDWLIDDTDVGHFRLAYDRIQHSFPELFFVGLHGRIAIPSKPNKPVQINAVDAPRNVGAVIAVSRPPRRV